MGRTDSATEYSSILRGHGAPAFQFCQMERLLRGRQVRAVTVDGVNAVFVNDPAMIRTILVAGHKNYGRGELFQKGRNISKAGILADDESVHRHFRRLAHPFLRAAKVDEYNQAMRGIAHNSVAAWRTGHTINIQTEMCRIAGAIAVGTLFPGLLPGTSTALSERLAVLTWGTIKRPIYGKAASRARQQKASSQQLARAHQDLRQLIISCLDSRPRSQDSMTGYPSALLSGSGEKSDLSLTMEQVCDEAILLLSAATVTTASVMSWALYMISEDPQLEKELFDDVADTENGYSMRGTEDCQHSYTARFLMEVLRLYPPIWIHCRKTRSSVTLGAYHIPGGTNVVFSPYLLHRNPDSYPNPYRFDPGRWLSARSGAADDALYIPFGIGPKGCIGEPFAWQELGIMLSAVMHRWRLSTKPGSQVRAAAETMLHPRQLLMIPQPR